jgi:hypothetical protein
MSEATAASLIKEVNEAGRNKQRKTGSKQGSRPWDVTRAVRK